jgi:hypothetical protein
MSDQLLKALAELEREEDQAVDPRLEALARGTIDPATRAELEATKSKDEVDAYTPVGDAAQERFLAGAVAAFHGSTSSNVVVELAAKRRRKLTSGLVVLAIAASVSMIFLRPSSTSPPAYVLEISAGDRTLRSGDLPENEVPRFAPSSRIEVVLRPATAIEDELEARAFYAGPGEVRSLPKVVEKSDGGAFRFAGRVDEVLPGATGEIELGFLIGPKGSLPTDQEAWQNRAAKDRPFQVLSRRVQITPSEEQ